MEQWKDIKGYEGLYQVSDQGRVKSLNYLHTGREQLLKPQKNTRGYLYVCLCKDGKMKRKRVHRLVYSTFKGEIPDGYEVNHIDEDKMNNRLDNLNLMTRKENNNYGTRNERVAKANINHPKISKKVGQYLPNGILVRVWESTMEADRNGFQQQSISACCNGKLKTHKGYIWRYAS